MTASDMYLDFFGLTERPFSLVPDPDFLFWSDRHRAAFAILEYGIVTRSPITVLTGEIGVGKTTLLQHMLHVIEENTTVGLISNAQGGRGELARWVLNALSVKVERGADYVDMYQALQDHLVDEYTEGRRVALVIDEAQNLSVEALEELRLMTNINSGKDELLQLILVGQPELRSRIMRPELQQFAQRVVAAYHLGALSAEATADYICHRIRHAGGNDVVFKPEALVEIHRHTGGIPRLINKLAEFCLVYGALSEESPISAETVRQVVGDGVFITGFGAGERVAE
ncbi:ExeA family protein [Aliiruegeria haliotis]|uniref:ExeA family protein n=1 Tax=Aliiruegeria haliotis TaxID=1280846 RepID=UPI001FED031D|nr:AAA family ATPase [Aliiruegeria haliotis]